MALALVALAPMSADARGLTTDETTRLSRGEIVRREVDLDLPQGDYVGGVAYAIVHAPPDAVMAALGDVGAYTSILPLARDAREVGRRGRDTMIAVRHAARFGEVEYTMVVRRESRA